MATSLIVLPSCELICSPPIPKCEEETSEGASKKIDKVSINTAAIHEPELVRDAAARFGSQCIVVAIDVKRVSAPDDAARYELFTHGGRKPTGIEAVSWAKKMAALGAGELLLTSMDRDGTRDGFELVITRTITDAVDIPVIASGGVGTLQHLADGVTEGGADAVLAASIFHFGEYTVGEAKAFMADQGITMRVCRDHPWETLSIKHDAAEPRSPRGKLGLRPI